jgi:starch synthase
MLRAAGTPMQPLKVLFIAAEAAPFAKTGGLADVVGALPKALAAMGHDVRIAMPAHASIEEALGEGRWGLRALPERFEVPFGPGTVPTGVLSCDLPGAAVHVYFVANRDLLGRERIYGYEDDPWRYAYFSRAALEWVDRLGWRPDVVHAHDWHAAPAVTWLATAGSHDDRFRGIPTVFTVHNLMHQGRGPWGILDALRLVTNGLREEGFGQVNFMARGIYHATLINTVSPTYAREILTPEGGQGLHELLGFRHYDVHGILNGIDVEVWNPAADPHLAAPFDVDRLRARAANKTALQETLGLPVRREAALVAMVSRLDVQKGLDIAGEVILRLLERGAGDAQFVVLGSGTPEYEGMFRALAGRFPDRMRAVFGYDPNLAPLLYAGSDVFLMPSRFEPCGLGQLLAMRYGSVPVVRAVGGLADTVRDGITGFTFHAYEPDDFWEALRRALYLRTADPESWREIQTAGMRQDLSWRASARGYLQLYEWAQARVFTGR